MITLALYNNKNFWFRNKGEVDTWLEESNLTESENVLILEQPGVDEAQINNFCGFELPEPGEELETVEITVERTQRVCMNKKVNMRQLKELINGYNPFEDEFDEHLDCDISEYDYAVCDADGITIVHWSRS